MQKLLSTMLLAATAVPANAGFVIYTDLAGFQTAAGTTTTYNFPVSQQRYQGQHYSLGPATFNANVLTELDHDGLYGGVSYLSTIAVNEMDVSLTGAYFAAAFNTALHYANAGSAPTDIFVNGAYATTFSGATVGTRFYGFVSTDPITSVTFQRGGNAGGISIDFTQFMVGAPDAAEVPEPAMLSLFGLGAIGLGMTRRRKGAVA